MDYDEPKAAAIDFSYPRAHMKHLDMNQGNDEED